MNQTQHEDLSEIQAKIETEVFVTQKERVDKLPESRGTKMGKNKENKSKNANKQIEQADVPVDENFDSVSVAQSDNAVKKLVQGITYRKLRPEVKLTLEKVIYQLELCAKSLKLLESRVINGENKLQNVMDWIKNNDIEYVSTIF